MNWNKSVRGGQLIPDIIQQKAQAAILRLIPGFDAIRLATIAANVAIAGNQYRLVEAHANNLIIKGPDWPGNGENLSQYCTGMKDNLRAIY
jgi:hypothetical protein